MRVLSVPSGHRYVRHLADPTGPDGFERLPDPPVPGAAPGVWWPAPALDPDWVSAHHTGIDVVHGHFGFESRTPAQLAEWVHTLRGRGLPLVLTVHDLTNPHLRDQAEHLDRLGVLIPAADALITLTVGAALEVRQRWGRPVHVVPHPHMAPLSLIDGPRPARAHGAPIRVGVHLKSLRANVDALGVLPALADACAAVDRAQLVVHVHHDVLDPGFPRHDPALVLVLTRLEDAGLAEVHRVDPMSDRQLWDYLRGLDLSVLPYRWGTHSGWLEECLDLGTPVLVPDLGHFAAQGRVLTYRRAGDAVDAESVREAVQQVADGRARPRVTRARRTAQRRKIAHAHRQIYGALVRASRKEAS